MVRIHQYWVYILTNAGHSMFYVGVTNDLHRRVHEHRAMEDKESFTARYRVLKLVYYERHHASTKPLPARRK